MGRRILALPVGAKYGRLTVVENLGTDHTKHNRVMVECDCGSARKTVYASRSNSSKAQNDVKVWIDHMIRVAGFFGKERRQ